MTLRLGSKIIPTISLYKATGVVPQGVFEVPSRSGTYDIKSYAFAHAEFEDNLEKRLNGTLSYYSNSTATSIATYAFAGANITSVSLPNVTTVSNYAFAYCESLTSIYLPKATNIGSYVFAECTNLSSFSFPSCSTIGGTYAFISCTALPSNLVFPSNFTTIIGGAFNYCANLQTVQCLGATSVAAFGSCSNLTTLSLPVCTYLGGCSWDISLQTVYAPNLISIVTYALASCGLTSVSFPVCVSIQGYAFANCKSLTSANLPKLSIADTGIFQNCYSLETVNIQSCAQIGMYAFQYCSSLTTLSVPLCSSIGNYAFYGCSSFSTLYLASNSVVTLGGASVFTYTQIYYSSKYGSIFVPASLVDAYKSATNWTAYSSKITSI